MRTKSFWVGLLTMMSASVANASPILPSLAPGSIYFLAFVTAGTRDATSSNIADYDAFVTAQAYLDPTLAALGTTWKAIGSTATADAITHINVTGPVYNLNGQKVATGSPDMFDGTLAAPISYDQFGNTIIRYVWTGSLQTGLGSPLEELGLPAYGSQSPGPMSGHNSFTSPSWIWNTAAHTVTTQQSLYGISGPLEVPTAVPEPSTIGLMLGPLLLLLGTHRRWRHRLATPTMRSDPAFH